MSAKYNRPQSQVIGQKTGIAPLAYIGIKSEMLVIGEVSGAPATPADTFKISTDHTFQSATPAKGFMEVYSLIDKTQLESSSFGSPGATNSAYSLKLFLPGDGPKEQAMLEEIRNQEVIILANDAVEPGGNTYQFGSKKIPALIKDIKFDSGTIIDGVKGWSIEFQAVNRFFYTGTVTVMD